MPDRPHLPASVISAEDAPAFWRVGILWNISLSAETTAGEFTMMDQTMPQGSGAPPHIHERYDEGFFIINGAVQYTVGQGDEERTMLAEDGGAVWIPRGTRHAFEVKSDTARALNFYTPGGFDESISMLATQRPPRRSRPPTAPRATPAASRPSQPRRRPTANGSPNCTHSRCPDHGHHPRSSMAALGHQVRRSPGGTSPLTLAAKPRKDHRVAEDPNHREQCSKREAIALLRRSQGPDAARNAEALLPDPVDLRRDAALLTDLGLTLSQMMNDLGASP